MKSTGIAFITEANEIAEADYPRDGERRRAGSPCFGEKVKGGEMGGREMKKVRRSRRDGRETQPGCTSPIRLQTSVRVGVCESKSETVTLRGGGAASVPFFKQASPGRNMNNNDSGNAACKNQTNIPTFFWLLSSA